MKVYSNHKNAADLCGFIPYMLDEADDRKAAEQFNERYAHGGGWQPFSGFVMHPDFSIEYPGDPALHPVASMYLRDELIVVYDHAWVAIIQPDGAYEICRMD